MAHYYGTDGIPHLNSRSNIPYRTLLFVMFVYICTAYPHPNHGPLSNETSGLGMTQRARWLTSTSVLLVRVSGTVGPGVVPYNI
jgi:hypothetical protein